MIDIAYLRPRALAAAQAFIGTTAPLSELGWGVSGIVFLAPDLRTAIKVHHRADQFETEVRAYQILGQHRITVIHGLTVPRMQRFDPSRHLIQMDFVSPPFLLDFAGVKFSDPQFSPETIAEIFEDIDLRFGPNADIAYAVYHTLRQIGIYYLDLRPSNLNVTGLPGADSTPEPNEDW